MLFTLLHVKYQSHRKTCSAGALEKALNSMVYFFVTEGRLYQVISLETQHNMMSATRRSGKALRILLLSSFLLRSNVQGYI